MRIVALPGPFGLLAFVLSLMAAAALTAGCAQRAEVHEKKAARLEKARDDLFSLSFPSETEGWACGRHGIILHTSDGGQTWKPQSSGTDATLSSICFTDLQNGWAVGARGTILHTHDGGLTWESQESPVESFHMRVVFLSSRKGFIASEHTHILATEDGGRNWTVRFRDEDFILRSLSFGDPLHGWAVGEFGCIYSTADGGRRWEKQAGTYEIDSETGDLKGEGFLFDVVAIDRQTVWAVGIQGTVKQTADGGRTWRNVDVGAGTAPLFCIAHDGSDTLMVAGKGICLLSSDRGKTWTRVHFAPSIRYGWVHHIARLGSTGLAAACGEGGSIYRKLPAGVWNGIAY